MKAPLMGWWTDQRWQSVGYCDSTLGMSIGANAMLERALSDGRTVEEANTVGMMTNGIIGLLSAAEGAGGRVVWAGLRDPCGDKAGRAAALVVWPWATLSVRPMHLRRLAQVHVACADADLMTRILTLLREQMQRPERRSSMTFVICSGPNGAAIQPLGLAGVPLRRENYTTKVLEGFDHVVGELACKDPCGRITIFDGPPGTGKTHLIRALLSEAEARFVLVPPELLPSLSGPSLLPLLLGNRTNAKRPLVLVIEDADACLVPRAADNISALASLLNLGDGIVGCSLDLRVILTTNAKHVDIDSAVVRPGRLCRRIHVEPLPSTAARAVLESLIGAPSEPPPQSRLTLADVYALARKLGWSGRSHAQNSTDDMEDEDEEFAA